MLTGARNDNLSPAADARAGRLAHLRGLVRSLEGWGRVGFTDAATPWEAVSEDDGWMQEVWAAAPDAYASALLFLLSALQAGDKAVLWVVAPTLAREHGLPYGPGLKALGLDPARLILVRAKTEQDALWAMDEGLRSGALSAVVGETGGMELSASRRLALTAKEQGLRCLLLVRAPTPVPSAAYSRWQVQPAPSAPVPYGARLPGAARVTATLLKHRGGHPLRTHELEWHDATHRFHMAAALADRPLAPPASRIAG